MPNTSQQIGTGSVQARQVHAGAAGRVPGVLRLLGSEAEDAEPDHQLLLEVVDDEARAAEGRDRHGVPVVHADGGHLAPEAEGSPGLLGRGRPHPLPDVQRDPRPGEQRSPSGVRSPTSCRARRSPRGCTTARCTPLYSMVPSGYPGHIDAFAALYGRVPNPAKAKQVLQAAGVTTPYPGRDLVDADALRRRLGRRVRGDQARAREERPLHGDVEVDRVGAVQRDARDAVQRLPARVVPGLRGRRGLRRALLPLRHVHAERLQEPADGGAHPEGAGSCQALPAPRVHQADPDPGCQGRTDHPLLAAGDDRGRPEQRARDPEHARPDATTCGSRSCRSRRLASEGGVAPAPPSGHRR